MAIPLTPAAVDVSPIATEWSPEAVESPTATDFKPEASEPAPSAVAPPPVALAGDARTGADKLSSKERHPGQPMKRTARWRHPPAVARPEDLRSGL
jgi:hypothetical protein